MTKLERMIETIRGTTGSEFIVGNEDIGDVAQAWLDAGFSADTAPQWWSAGCWDAERTENLRDSGLTPHQVAAAHPRNRVSWGYAYCNVDADIAEIVDACSDHDETKNV